MDKFVQKFIEEASDLLSELEEVSLLLEKDVANKEIIERIFRIMHTIKGSAGMFGFSKIDEFTHQLETIYDLIRNDKMVISDEILEITFASIDHIKDLLGSKLEGEGISSDRNPATYKFMQSLSHKLGWGYSDYDPYTNGNYAVFMNHGPWLKSAQSAAAIGKEHMNYISMFDSDKTLSTNHSKILDTASSSTGVVNFSQSVTDVDIPEPNKEYIAVSTRQKNSFVNTRDFAGSDFNLTFVENKNLDVFKYHEAWHKSIELIREGLLYVPEKIISVQGGTSTDGEYLIPNPYSNAVFVTLFEPKSYKITGLIVLFGVMPVNLPFKNLVGDRGGSKVATYTMNYKFMDMQYAFYDGWEQFDKSAAKDGTIAQLFAKFAGLTASASSS